MYLYEKGLVIGRFQPFHKGHLYLIHQALKLCEKIIIGIGSVNKSDESNPYPVDKRKKMLEKVLEQEKIHDRIEKIVFLTDVPDDDEWLQDTLKRTGEIDAVIGNNDWVNNIFTNAGYEIRTVPHFKRELYEGIKIRNLMKIHKKWEDRIPYYLIDIIKP